MILQRRLSVIFAITLATLPVTASSRSPERLKPIPGYTLSWDQGKVAVLTRQFANTAAEIRRDFGKQPVPAVGSKESRTYLILSDDLRLIESESGELAERIAKGASADESYPIYRRMGNLISDLRADAVDQTFPPPLQEKIERARAMLIELDPYYGDLSAPENGQGKGKFESWQSPRNRTGSPVHGGDSQP
jgi:hypothetical protein